jgi:glucan phosphoethanolaminetransferase (alkaline phosphatase superfamily)
MPTSVRVAVVAMAVLAALLLSNAALLWYSYDDAVDRIVREVEDTTTAEAERFVTLSLVPYLVIGVILALSALFLPRRQPWARWIGLAAAALLTLLTLFSVLATGGVSAASLLLLVLSVATVTSLVARPTKEWVPPLRAGA